MAARSIDGWGVRLGDKMRAALARGDVADARRLALDGDGQARDLAGEYAFMASGLGVTIGVMLPLLLDVAAAAPAPARRTLAACLDRLAGAPDAATAATAGEPTLAALAERADRCRLSLERGRQRLGREQAAAAAAVVRALDDGDARAAVVALDAKDDAWLAVHDPLVRFMADAFAWVLRHAGEHGLLDFHLATAEGQRPGFERWERLPAADFAATTAFLLRQHMGQVRVEEDARRFTIRQSPCGSGGRLRRDGAYEAALADGGPAAAGPPLPLVVGASPLTFGEPSLPVYCSHCAVWNGSATLRWFGRVQWVFERPARADGGCTLHLYKRAADIPAADTRRVRLPPAGTLQ